MICSVPFEDLARDAAWVAERMAARLGDAKLRANFQIQVLTGLFFRNKGCYIVGKLINGFNEFAVCAAGAAQAPLRGQQSILGHASHAGD